MSRIFALLLASTIATPGLAQHAGHEPAPVQAAQDAPSQGQQDPHAGHVMPAAPAAKATADPHAGHNMGASSLASTPPAAAPAASATDPHAGHTMTPAPAAPAQGRSSPAAPDPQAGQQMTVPPPSGSADPHAGHIMPNPAPSPAPPVADPHAGHTMPAVPAAPASDPHAGHQMPAQPGAADPHAGHDMSGSQAGTALPPATPPPAEAFQGPEHGADSFYDSASMRQSREELRKEHGNITVYRVLLDQLEARLHDGPNSYEWDAQAWYGGDFNKLWLKSEGEGAFEGGIENAEVQALWSRSIDPWFDLQLGVRQDLQPGPNRTHLVAGIQGLAPYWFEVEGTAFLSNKGDLTARFEGEYDLRLTQFLILQPRIEADFSLQDIPELRVGSGLSTAEVGARLRYEFYPRSGPAVVAPYIGIKYERAFGDTARFYRISGEDVGGWAVLLGFRTWF